MLPSLMVLLMTTGQEMCGTPTGDEVLATLLRIKMGMAAGSNGLLPDKCCSGPLLDFTVPLFGTVWREKQVPVEWRDTTLVPVPESGDFCLHVTTGEVSVYWI